MNNTSNSQTAQDRKLTKGELISYGLGGVASTMPSQFKTSYAMNFMSDVAGLNVGAVGILNTLLIIWPLTIPSSAALPTAPTLAGVSTAPI